MSDARLCKRCDEGVLSERIPKMGHWLCPNPTCAYSPDGPDPVEILDPSIPWPNEPMRKWERLQRDGLWWWAQVR